MTTPKDQMPELKSCPFCGATPVFINEPNAPELHCEDCDCAHVIGGTQREVYEVWNTRPSPPADTQREALDALDLLADRFDFENERTAGIKYRLIRTLLRAAAHKEALDDFNRERELIKYAGHDSMKQKSIETIRAALSAPKFQCPDGLECSGDGRDCVGDGLCTLSREKELMAVIVDLEDALQSILNDTRLCNINTSIQVSAIIQAKQAREKHAALIAEAKGDK